MYAAKSSRIREQLSIRKSSRIREDLAAYVKTSSPEFAFSGIFAFFHAKYAKLHI